MDARALMERLTARGVVLEVNGDKLRWTPKDALTPEEVETLRQNRAAIMACLRRGDRSSEPRWCRCGNHPLPPPAEAETWTVPTARVGLKPFDARRANWPLHQQYVDIFVRDGVMTVTAPKGWLTPERRQWLQDHSKGIITALTLPHYPAPKDYLHCVVCGSEELWRYVMGYDGAGEDAIPLCREHYLGGAYGEA